MQSSFCHGDGNFKGEFSGARWTMADRTVYGDGFGDDHPANDTRKDNAPIHVWLETNSAFFQA